MSKYKQIRHIIITGIFILLENQYRIGDSVDINGIIGKVEGISLRKTMIRDVEGVLHHIPHGEVKMVSNKSKGFSSINLMVGISYTDNIDKAATIINKIGEDMLADSKWGELLKEAPHFVRVQDLSDHSVVLKVSGDTHPGKQFNLSGELRKRIKEEFEKKGINIPYPQMVVHSK